MAITNNARRPAHGPLSTLLLVLMCTFNPCLGNCLCEFTTNSSTLSITCENKAPRGEISKCFHKYNTATELVFSNSFLTEIPEEINILHDLIYLDVSGNDIQELKFGQIQDVCNRLVHLHVNNNDIRVLEKGALDCLKSLTTFSIVNNSLSVIEDGAFNNNLRMLEFIYLMYNSLTSLDSSVAFLPMLKVHKHVRVNATRNNISYITNSINISITDIMTEYSIFIGLIHNNFTKVDIDYYYKTFHITKPVLLYRLWNSGFDLRFNPFICDCDMEPLAKALADFRWMDPDNPLFSITCNTPPALQGKLMYSVHLNEFNCTVDHDCPDGCNCIKTVFTRLVVVRCEDKYTLPVLPNIVPSIHTIHIVMKTAAFRHLSNRNYLTNTTLLDVAGCAIDTISNDILLQIAKIETVYLHDNSLITIPKAIEHIGFDGLKILTLRGNPFSCDCKTLWFKKWLIRNKLLVADVTRVLCANGPGKGNPIIHVKDTDFICEYPITKNELLIIVFSVIFLMIVILILIHYNRRHIHVLLIAYFNIYCFRKKATGEFPFDVFISHSSRDDHFVIETLMSRLETQQPPYKVFFDERDFIPGKTIVYNVIRAIEISRTTLLVLTNNFLRSEWCMMEFKETYLNMLTDNVDNCIAIVMEDLDEALMGDELKFYLKTNVYIKYTDRLFWPKLLQALPIAHSSPSTESLSESSSPLIIN